MFSVYNGVVDTGQCSLDTIDAKTVDKTEEKSIAHRDSFTNSMSVENFNLKYEDAIDIIEHYCIHQVQAHMC